MIPCTYEHLYLFKPSVYLSISLSTCDAMTHTGLQSRSSSLQCLAVKQVKLILTRCSIQTLHVVVKQMLEFCHSITNSIPEHYQHSQSWSERVGTAIMQNYKRLIQLSHFLHVSDERRCVGVGNGILLHDCVLVQMNPPTPGVLKRSTQKCHRMRFTVQHASPLLLLHTVAFKRTGGDSFI